MTERANGKHNGNTPPDAESYRSAKLDKSHYVEPRVVRDFLSRLPPSEPAKPHELGQAFEVQVRNELQKMFTRLRLLQRFLADPKRSTPLERKDQIINKSRAICNSASDLTILFKYIRASNLDLSQFWGENKSYDFRVQIGVIVTYLSPLSLPDFWQQVGEAGIAKRVQIAEKAIQKMIQIVGVDK
jgi:hypothetical protein